MMIPWMVQKLSCWQTQTPTNGHYWKQPTSLHYHWMVGKHTTSLTAHYAMLCGCQTSHVTDCSLRYAAWVSKCRLTKDTLQCKPKTSNANHILGLSAILTFTILNFSTLQGVATKCTALRHTYICPDCLILINFCSSDRNFVQILPKMNRRGLSAISDLFQSLMTTRSCNS